MDMTGWRKLAIEIVVPAHYLKSAEPARDQGMEQLRRTAVERIEATGYVIEAEEVLSNIRLRLIVSIFLLCVFAISVMLTYALIFLWGYGTIHLDNAFAHWLGGASVGQTATLLVGIVRYLFPDQGAGTKKKPQQPDR
jgi:hypothetical protein